MDLDAIERIVDNAVGGISDVMSTVIFFAIPIAGAEVPIVVIWLILAAIGFSIYFGFIQFRGFKTSLEVVRGRFSRTTDPGEVTHFQALSSALSATVGLGNIAGVAIAVGTGGPGATFWMILAGLFGMCTKFVECTVGVKYRTIDADGQVNGGPFKYLPVAFKALPKPIVNVIVGVFAISIIMFGVAGAGMFQTNQTFSQLQSVTGGEEDGLLSSPLAALVSGLLFAGLVAAVIVGGIRSIARVTSKLVPVMGVIYVLACLVVLLVNIENIPAAASAIVVGAFSPQGVAGGALGVLVIGIQRATFSNEAGIGSAPIAHSAVKTRRPVSEGFVASLEPFIDTVVICTMTALTIVIANTQSYQDVRSTPPDELGDTNAIGVALTSDAFGTVLPWFPYVLTLAVFLFAYSTIITWSYYGLKAWHFLFGRRRWTDNLYRAFLLFFVVIGCLVTLSNVVAMADAFLFACAFINVVGLVLLLPVVKREMTAYLRDRKAGTLHELGADDEAELAQIKREQGTPDATA